MEKRTIRVLGWGVDKQQSELTVTLDGATVFSGVVPLEEMTSENDSIATAPTLFSFEIPLDFPTVTRMKIVKDDATIRFSNIVGNYTLYQGPGLQMESGPFEFLDVAPLDDSGVRDPRNNVTINGRLQTPDRGTGMTGTWHWTIGPKTAFEHDLTITPAFE